MEDFKPRLNDELTDAVTIIGRAVGCVQAVNDVHEYIYKLRDLLTKYGNRTQNYIVDGNPSELVERANNALRVFYSNLGLIENSISTLEALRDVIEGDFRRRVADNLREHPITLYGVNVS